MTTQTSGIDAQAQTGEISQAPFGQTPDGREATLFTLRNGRGAEARITNYGGIVTALIVPDRLGEPGDVVLGYATLAGYLADGNYMGALIGRFGNRIGGGQFTLNGKTFSLATNNGPNHLHGGKVGYNRALWAATPRLGARGPVLELSHVSPDGEEGYPGALTLKAVYTLTADNGLELDMTATTDKDTIVNLTTHGYFNLAGGGDVLGHEVTIFAEKFLAMDETLIPTGELRPVAGTPLDFTTPHTIGERIGDADGQMAFGHGYDHCYAFDKPAGALGLMARIVEPAGGRVMEVLSSAPGMQFYTGNFLGSKVPGKGGACHAPRQAFCMEPQAFPDAPNKPRFPTAVLKAGATYRHTIVYRFSVR